jgi:hypothetical protein
LSNSVTGTPQGRHAADSWTTRVLRRLPSRFPEGLAGAVLVVSLVLAAGLVSGPLSALALDRHPQIGAQADLEPTAVALQTARFWPSWVGPSGASSVSLGAAGGTGLYPSSNPRVTAVRAGSTPLLSTGYRGWGAQPPAAVLTRSGASGQPSPLADEVRGIYLTAYTAGQPGSLRNLIALIDSTALNAMVINIKDEQGRATYDTKVAAFQEAGAVSIQIRDVEGLLRTLDAYGIYVIGRLVTFEDSTLPLHNPDLAVKRPDGSLWRDDNGRGWTDPFRQEVWEYNLALAEEAASLGFDEIQFDYVRFPTDGDTRNAVFSRPNGPDNANRVLAITEFLTTARERLAPYGCLVSADIFGITLSTSIDTSLGQVLETITPAVDYISPMIYPSHYGAGHFGLPSPDAAPYETVFGALSDGLERLSPEAKDKFRPWLQDFSLYNTYGAEEVLAQIRATHDLGIKGWLLWSPGNNYNVAALRAYTVNLEAYLEGGG